MGPMLLIVIGVAIGLVVAVPVGPVNVVAISATLRQGRLAGLLAGSGGVLGDTLIAAVAAFGISAVVDFVVAHEIAIQAVGGLLLVLFGAATTASHPHILGQDEAGAPTGLRRRVAATFLMTVTNPGALLGMLALFGALKPYIALEEVAHPLVGPALVVAGVAIGGSLWWLALTSGVSLMKGRLTDRWLETVNRIAGVLLMAVGLALGGNAAIDLLRG